MLPFYFHVFYDNVLFVSLQTARAHRAEPARWELLPKPQRGSTNWHTADEEIKGFTKAWKKIGIQHNKSLTPLQWCDHTLKMSSFHPLVSCLIAFNRHDPHPGQTTAQRDVLQRGTTLTTLPRKVCMRYQHL